MRASTQKARGFFPGMCPGLRLFGVSEQDSAAPTAAAGLVVRSRGVAHLHRPSALNQVERVGQLNQIEIESVARATAR